MKLEDITIERYTSPVVQWYKNDGTLLGELYNEHEFNKMRIQLITHQLTDTCYFMWNNHKITLSKDGNMSSFPVGLYDQMQRDLFTIISLRRK